MNYRVYSANTVNKMKHTQWTNKWGSKRLIKIKAKMWKQRLFITHSSISLFVQLKDLYNIWNCLLQALIWTAFTTLCKQLQDAILTILYPNDVIVWFYHSLASVWWQCVCVCVFVYVLELADIFFDCGDTVSLSYIYLLNLITGIY